ncbi:hypothetical protein [Levilactobacillus suantsaiihabitans]|uniref:hypothetical protein n=1 Tax=Levilactobacillus suantsaiihabitans TaxID=2487722 RepID=UPI00107F2556|nr:hypothetical protein [Levilactobacillus suantsaiihabitans]
MDKPDIVQVKMPRQAVGTAPVVPSRAVQLKVGKISQLLSTIRPMVISLTRFCQYCQLFGAYYGLLLGVYRGPTGG